MQYIGHELEPPPFSHELQITGVNFSHILIGFPPPKGERGTNIIILSLHTINGWFVTKYSFFIQDMSCGVSKLTGMERRILQRKLHEESEVLNKHFRLLLENIQRYLIKNCTCKFLIATVTSTIHVRAAFKDPSLNKLKSASSANDVICILEEKDMLSFLHYELIEIIVTSCCDQSDEIKDLFKIYKNEFNEYIRRRVCETSFYSNGKFKVLTRSDSKETVDLVIVTDENWNNYSPFLSVLELEYAIAKVFRGKTFFLALRSIEPDLKLHYAIIPSLVDHIFPLTLEEWNNLICYGVTEIHCREYHYMVNEKCKFHMVHVLYDVLTVMYSILQQLQEKDQ